MGNNWKEIWQKKGLIDSSQFELAELISISGFDTGAGKISVDSWVKYVNYIIKRLDIGEKDRILEIGCGGGAFLYPIFIYYEKINVTGIDYCESLIEIM